MSRVLNNYRIFCITENKFITIWSDTKPITCSNNSLDTIDLNSITIIDTISSNDVNIIQSSPGSSGDNYRVQAFSMTIPANSQTIKDMKWNYPVNVMTVNFCIGSDHVNDLIDGYIAPDTTIGAITKNISQGDSIIHVSPTIFTYLNIGYLITVTNGSQKVNLGECIQLNPTDMTIKCINSANAPILAGAYVQMTIHNIANFIICEPANVVSLATKHLVSTPLPAGIIARLVYTNNSNTDKTFCYYCELLY